MEGPQHRMHFGMNCRHLKRDDYPADGRCALAIQRYSGPEYAFLDTRTAVSLKLAARLLETTQDAILQRAKAGELGCFFPENVAKRISIRTKTGERRLTVTQAAKHLGKSVAEIDQLIAAGEIAAEYPDELIRIFLATRWEYERCPLFDQGGVCYHFEPHDGPQIRCLAEAPAKARVTFAGTTDELDSH